jgi:hypothetical protein
MAVEIVISSEEANKIARGFLDHQINLENLNCLMYTTGNELEELCLILKTRRLGREIKQIRIDNGLLDDEEREELKHGKKIYS